MHEMSTSKPTPRATILPFKLREERVLAEFSTRPEPGFENGSRWTCLRISRLATGKYLCEKQRGPGAEDVAATTVDDLDDARSFFGGGWVVRELFEGIDAQRYPRWD